MIKFTCDLCGYEVACRTNDLCGVTYDVPKKERPNKRDKTFYSYGGNNPCHRCEKKMEDARDKERERIKNQQSWHI